MSEKELSNLAQHLLSRAHRRPLLAWERRDLGYSRPDQRTLGDALKTEKYYNCQKLKQITDKLRPNDDEIVAVVTINPINSDKAKARQIASDVLKCVRFFRYWVSFIEPTHDGLPHINLLIRIRKKHLGKFEAYLHELTLELFKAEGFARIIDLKLCDSAEWHNHKKGEWPWPIGYSAKGANNLDYILSFTAWVKSQGGRWYSESKRCVRTDPSPLGYVPSFCTQNFPTKSTTELSAEPGDVSVNHSPPPPPRPPIDANLEPLQDINDPRYFNFQWSNERRNTRLQDEADEHAGRLLNDSLCTLQYAKSIAHDYPDLIDSSGLPSGELPEKYIDLIKKALESRDESILSIVRASVESEQKQAEEIRLKPLKERQKKVKKLWSQFFSARNGIIVRSRDESVHKIASELHKAVSKKDGETLGKYGLDRRNSLVFDEAEIGILQKEIIAGINKFSAGEGEEKAVKKIEDNIKKLNKHLHCLKFAEIHNEVDNLKKTLPMLNPEKRQKREELISQLMRKIGQHNKATMQGYHLKNSIIEAQDGRLQKLNEKAREYDFRSDKTRAAHGRKPVPDCVKIVPDLGELRAREKSQKIRELELICAAEAAEKAAMPRVRRPRQPRAKPAKNAP